MSTLADDNKLNGLLKALISVGIIFVLILVALLLKKGFSEEPLFEEDPVTITVEPTITIQPDEELDIGQRVAGTTEEIIFTADPPRSNDSIWLIRLRFENADVLQVRNYKGLMLPACDNKKNIDIDKVCVDIANGDPFYQGQEVFLIKVFWHEGGKIFRQPEDGYFNGVDLSYSVEDHSRVAGVDTSATTISFSSSAWIMITIGCVLIFLSGVGLFLIFKDKQKTGIGSTQRNAISSTIVMSSFGLLAFGTIVAAAMLANTDTAPLDSSALLTTYTPVYIYVSPTAMPLPTETVTPSPTMATPSETPVPTVTPIATISLSPTPSSYPDFIVIYITQTPPPPSIIYVTATPTPTVPLTDNIYTTCGLIDVNSDTRLDYIDYNPFMSVYNHYCIDSTPTIGCGGKDSNSDGFINYIDLFYFQTNYYPRTLNCTIF